MSYIGGLLTQKNLRHCKRKGLPEWVDSVDPETNEPKISPKKPTKKQKRLREQTAKEFVRENPSEKTHPLQQLIRSLLKAGEMMSGLHKYRYQNEFLYRFYQSLILRLPEILSVIISRQAGKTQGNAEFGAVSAVFVPFLADALKDDPYFDQYLNAKDEQGNYRGFRHGLKIGIFAPTKDQARITFNRVKSILATDASQEILAELGVEIDTWNGDTILFSNGSKIKCASAAPTAKIEGDTLHVVIAEEAQDLDDQVVKKSIHPFVASTAGLIIKIGTAGTKVCDFLREIQRNKKKHAETGGLRCHFEYNAKVCSQYNSFYAKYVERERETLGEDSDEFQMSYMCRWKVEREMFITEEKLNDKRFGLVEGKYSVVHDSAPLDWDVVAGIDIAKTKDSTVVTVIKVDWENPIYQRAFHDGVENRIVAAHRKHVLGWLELRGDDYETQFHAIHAYLSRFKGLKRIVMDANGVGAAPFDRFAALYAAENVDCVPFMFNQKPKSDGYKLLRSEIDRWRLTFPNSETAKQSRENRRFRGQMVQAEKVYNGSYLSVQAPPNEHEDYCDSLMLAVWGCESGILVPQVAVHNENFFYN